jgi:metal-responsive CopG/Arc/MetJ family transcriptional regulator
MSDVRRDVRITVRIPAELRHRLKKTAERAGTRESDLVRDALETRLSAEEGEQTVFDRMKQAGLIGIIGDAPSDLSTSREHFDGFGER